MDEPCVLGGPERSRGLRVLDEAPGLVRGGLGGARSANDELARRLVDLQQRTCLDARELLADAEPHFLLAMVWLARLRTRGIDIDDEDARRQAYRDTYPLSCLPHPINARALGLFILARERPDLLDRHPALKSEYRQLTAVLDDRSHSGWLADAYRLYNPVMSGRPDRSPSAG